MFAEYAPKYWAAGLPVMPLRPVSKVPALPAWQMLCAQMPTEGEQQAWLAGYPDGNMGLPLGPQSGIIALDLDSEDPRVQRVLDVLMPLSPWKRVGKKGAVYAFKYNGERTYRIKDSDGGTVLEVLSRGAQIVLPPSIHPDTQRPYAANCELVDVLDQLVPLPAQFETMIRQGLIDAGIKLTTRGSTKITEWVPTGGRDSAMTAFAGLQARGVIHKEITLLEALNQMEAWVVSFTENVVGDQLSPEKGRKKVLEFLRRDVTENNRQLPKGWDAGMTEAEKEEMREYFGEEAESWTTKEFMDHIQNSVVAIASDDVVGKQEIVGDVLAKMSKASNLNEIDSEVILTFLGNATGKLVTIATLRKQLRELKGSTLLGNDHTEIAEALMKDLEQAGEIRFDRGSFYQWFGSHWRKMDEAEIMRRLSKEFGHLPAAKKFNDHKGILQVAQRHKTASLVEDKVVGINFANGYLTSDMELLPHEPRFGATYVLPYRYMPDERAPAMFMSFLDQAWGGDPDYLDKVQALREAIAVTLFGQATVYQRAFCLFGMPGSGKSELLKMVMGLIPQGSVCMVPPQDWGDKFMPAMMMDALMNHCGELSESQMIPGVQFKLVVEGAEMSGQFKGQQIFQFKPRCAQWFSSNHLPRTRDTSDGFNRRWLILGFNRACPADQRRDGMAEEILSEEREAIVAWAVPAMQDLLRRHEYTIPSSHIEHIEEVAQQNNSVRFFFTSGEVVNVVPSPEDGSAPALMSEKELYALYYGFCRAIAHAQPVALKRFRVTAMELQSQLGFKLEILRTGIQDSAVYLNLTLAKAAAGSRMR